jgi:hypothetical protein
MPIMRPLQRTWGLEPGIVILEGRLDIGAAGAVQSTSRKPGLTVVRNGAGDYTLTLSDGVAPRGIVGLFQLLVASGSAALYARMTARTSSSLRILCEDAAGADTDPPSGSEIHYIMVVGNSSVQSPA